MAERAHERRWTEPGHYGLEGRGVVLAEATIAGAWNLQGDAGHAPFVDAARDAFGVALPIEPNTVSKSKTLTALWLGPKSWLLVAGGPSPLNDCEATRDALNSAHGALFDVSASRVAWTISGPRATTVLANGCPLDFHPRAFAAETCAQSLLGHINALIERRDASTFNIMVARSFVPDVWHSLCETAAQYGFEVRSPQRYR